MDSRTQERVEQWESRPFSGGTDGLSDLADRGFSGAIHADGAWTFVLNGRAVGTVDGDLEDVVTTPGTLYEAPDPSLPLLATMEETGGETRAKYYTNETPLQEVDETLRGGSFTGYVELSEKVLSGDYYLVYYGGRRMAAAFIGNAERLITDDEAFERAADEVGIYEVIDVDVDVTDLRELVEPEPEPEPELESESKVEPESESMAESESESIADPARDVADEPAVTSASSSDDESVTAGEDSEESAGASPTAEEEPASAVEPGITADADRSTAPSAPGIVEAKAVDEESDAEPTAETGGASSASGATESDAPSATDSGRATGPDATDTTGDDSDLEERLKQEARWRETKSIPSIDPDNTNEGERDGRRRSSRGDSSEHRRRSAAADAGGTSSTERPASGSARPRSTGSREASQSGSTRSDRSERGASSERTGRIEGLEKRCKKLTAQRDELVEERDRLRSKTQQQSATIERLQSRIDQLETELERARASSAAPAGGGTQLSSQQALAGTNLFVRYGSKSEATLESAHAGEADAGEVGSNLRLEHHTEFDDADAVVDGVAYEEFLQSTMEFRTVDWLVNTLVYEIRDTGRADDLGDLYDAIPRIDRAEFDASVSLAEDDTEDVPDEVRFDVVAYDKMGHPLVVLVLNDSREPASRELLEELEASASAVKANYPELAAALVVTSSFFEPGALEITEEATSAGFLSRGSKLSYVNLSRKQGYHLCLVEARSGGFHVTVPEL